MIKPRVLIVEDETIVALDIQDRLSELGYEVTGVADRGDAESSAEVARRVERSREIQLERYKGTKIHCNAQMTPRFIRKYCELDPAGSRMLELVTDRLGFSARTYNRILKVARTIADLEESESIRDQHIAEAIQYRSLDRKKI